MPRERQLFVAGLSPGYTQEQLYKLFHNFGPIEASSVTMDGKGKTIGFVTFLDAQAARDAETLLHGKRTNGVGPLVVVPALSRSEKNETNSSSVKYQADPSVESSKSSDAPIISKLQAAMSQSGDTPPSAPLNLAQRQRQKFLAQYQQSQQVSQPQQQQPQPQQHMSVKGGEGDIIDKLLAAGMSGDDVNKCMEERKNAHLAVNHSAAMESRGQHISTQHHRVAGSERRQPATDEKDSRIQELEKEILRLKESSMPPMPMPNTHAHLNASLLRNAGKGAPQKPVIPSSLLGNLPLSAALPNLQPSLQNDDFQKQLQVLQMQSQLLPQSLLPTTPLPGAAPSMPNSDALQQAYTTILNHQQQQLQQLQLHNANAQH